MKQQSLTLKSWLNRTRDWAVLALAAFFYFVSARLGLFVAFEQTNASPIWPASGVAFAAFLLFGPRVWPGILAGAFFANAVFLTQDLAVGHSGIIIAVSSLIGLGNTLEAWTGFFLLSRLVPSLQPFERAKDVLFFVLAAGLMCLVAALIGPISMCLMGLVPWTLYPEMCFTWWLGDTVGVLLFTPFLLTIAAKHTFRWQSQRWFAALLWQVFLLGMAYLVFGEYSVIGTGHYPLSFLLIPPLLWAAFGFGQMGTTLSSLTIAIAAIWGTLRGFGPFVLPSLNESLLILQAFSGTVSVTGLLLSATLTERKKAQESLEKVSARLESQVQDRTRKLLASNELLKGEIEHRKLIEDEMCKTNEQLEKSQEASLNIMEDLNQQKRELEETNKALSHEIFERQQAEEALRQKNIWMMLLEVVAVAANQAASVEEAIQICLDEVCAHTEWKIGHAYLIASRSEELLSTDLWAYPAASKSFQKFRQETEALHFLPGVELPGKALATAKPVWIDLVNDPHFLRKESARKLGLQTGFGCPILMDHEVMAVLEFFSAKAAHPEPVFLEIMTHIGSQISRLIERKLATEAIEKAYGELEHKVEERTRELARTNQELQKQIAERIETERGILKASEELKVANERLKQMDRMKSDFISAASHELRTPLTSIKGYIAIILKEKAGLINDKQKEFLTYVKEATDRLHRLLNELLDITRIESGRVKLKIVAADMAQLLKKEALLFKAQADAKQIQLEIDIEPGLKFVQCDQDKMKEVAANLLSNAIKYTPEGGKVRIAAYSVAGGVQVDFEDNGIGIREEDQEKIFEPFQIITKNPMNEESTGLGLALVKRILQLHQSKICVRSQREKGTTFYFVLPAAQAQESLST